MVQKRTKKKSENNSVNHGLKIKSISPKTQNQKRIFDAFYDGQHLFLHGVAGTGKTFISLYLTLNAVLDGYCEQNKVIIVRSAAPSRDMGFLPGNSKEKMKEYEAPYEEICAELFERDDAFAVLKNKRLVEFKSTSFNRGINMRDAFVIVDETQNMTAQELNTVITRVGENSRVIFAGDIRQTDLVKKYDLTGIPDFIKIIRRMDAFTFVELGPSDILRSALVKDYILTRDELERTGSIAPLSRNF